MFSGICGFDVGRCPWQGRRVVSESVSAIADHLADVRRRIAAAAQRAGRNPDDVMLLPVTKTVGVTEIRTLYDLGVRAIGENRVAGALEKADAVAPPDLAYHMIGHLQRNKVKKALKVFSFIHSVDSIRLARAIGAELDRQGGTLPCLAEVNTSGEAQKHGMLPGEVMGFLEEVSSLPGVRIEGLMTMAMLTGDAEETRPCFAQLRELADEARARDLPDVRMKHLSMGMTQDYEVAVEEGATIVRVGSAIFAGL